MLEAEKVCRIESGISGEAGERIVSKGVFVMSERGNAPGPPWSWQPSLQKLTEEAGVNFDEFIEYLREGVTDEAMAQKFHVSVQTIADLREHFERYGIDSVIGQD